MSAGERGPTGDHGQAGDQGIVGIQGERGYTGAEGHEGAPGERGQGGDTGQVGPKGEKGEKGERYSSWLTRNVVKAYVLLAAGLLLFVVLTQYQERQNDERDAKAMARFEAQVVADAKESCVRANEGRSEVNRNRDAIRALEIAVRQSYELVVPASDATAIQRQRVNEFRTRILTLLDTVKVDGNLALRDCSTIGNGAPGLATTTTTRPPG